jgi:pimeloyl-ACP methyl ester carboxylesterase
VCAMGADTGSSPAPAGRGWCRTGSDLCAHWERRLLSRLRSAHTVRDVPVAQSVFGSGHWIRTLDTGAGVESACAGERGGGGGGGGGAQKPVVLLLHGFGNGLGVWFLCVDALVDV